MNWGWMCGWGVERRTKRNILSVFGNGIEGLCLKGEVLERSRGGAWKSQIGAILR